jgi:hypothetical protein
MDGRSRQQDHRLMRLNPRRSRQKRRAIELVGLEAFRTVRRVADEELRELASAAPASPEVAAARVALEAATTAEEVAAIEPLVRTARSVLGADVPDNRQVRIGERWITWADAGGSYAGVMAASRSAEVGASSDQRHLDVRATQRDDQARGWDRS